MTINLGACRAAVARYHNNMNEDAASVPNSIALPPARISIGVTGHRDSNAAFAAHRPEIEKAMQRIFDCIDEVTAKQSGIVRVTRLHALLALGSDLIAVEHALKRRWEVIAPLPFGLDLNIAINVGTDNVAEARAVLMRERCANIEMEEKATIMRDASSRARLFQLAEQDRHVTDLLIAKLSDPADVRAAQDYSTIVAERVASAGRLMIEQSDILIAIWDGVTPGAIGGTRHTMSAAVNLGTPVIWINAADPGQIRLLKTPEELFAHENGMNLAIPDLQLLFEATLSPPEADQNERAIRFHTEQWHRHSSRRFHAYRRIEAIFGGTDLKQRFGSLKQIYETPKNIAAGSGAAVLAAANGLPGGDGAFVSKVEVDILKRFAWADGLSTYLSDAYRGGMVTNFLLSALAIIVGVAYLPLASVDSKWPFALAEFILLMTILVITHIGQRRRWHGRWFETRRVAEYFRHAPIMLMLGVARASGRWPRGADTGWPEFYARQVLSDIGLPSVKVEQHYLRQALKDLLQQHAAYQRRYHEQKARRLARVHHRLDKLSEWLFVMAVLSVATYLMLVALAAGNLVPADLPHNISKMFTFLGVILPALGGTFAGIRYFGDFERFASISETTAEKLSELQARIAILSHAPEGSLRYSQIAELTHTLDDIVVSEIENWQSVFGSKQIAVPV